MRVSGIGCCRRIPRRTVRHRRRNDTRADVAVAVRGATFPGRTRDAPGAGTSMAVILFTAMASLRKHHQHGAVDWAVVRGITPGILVGTALGATFAAIIPHASGSGVCIVRLFRSHADPARSAPARLTPVAGSGWHQCDGCVHRVDQQFGFDRWRHVVIPFLVCATCRCVMPSARLPRSVFRSHWAVTGYIVIGSHLSGLPSPHLGYVYLPRYCGWHLRA